MFCLDKADNKVFENICVFFGTQRRAADLNRIYTAVSKKVVLQKSQTLNSKRARCDWVTSYLRPKTCRANFAL